MAASAPNELRELWSRARGGDVAALSRVLTLVETDGPQRAPLVSLVFPDSGNAHRIGLAGPPGAGKSTLAAEMGRRLQAAGARVGIIAVDPSSPISGGALLGDRVRMGELDQVGGVFIRSLASRGHAGGLSLAAALVADALDGAGYDRILLETLGVGQGELDIVPKAHTVLLLLLPGTGDAVQLMKAGLLELADVFVINKADREGAATLAELLRSHVAQTPRPAGAWAPPVLSTTAYRGEGVDEVVAAVDRHLAHLVATGGLAHRRRAGIRAQLRQLVEADLLQRMWADPVLASRVAAAADELDLRHDDPITAARRLAAGLLPGARGPG